MQTGKVLRLYARTPYVAQFESDIRPEPLSWFRIAERSRLTQLRTLDAAYTADAALVSAFVEHWHPETNSFHFYFGEMTMTLHDVYFILGLPIQGRSCHTNQYSEEDIKARLFEDFGLDQATWRIWTRAGGVMCDVVQEKLRQWMDEEDRDESRIARLPFHQDLCDC